MLSTTSLSPELKSRIKSIVLPKAPKRVVENFRQLDSEHTSALVDSLKQHYFTRSIWEGKITTEAYLASAEGQADLQDHLDRRLDNFRHTVIPWLNDAKPLAGATILEIGCGTGSSTVALAEQGAKVVAVDIDAPSLQVARDRMNLYGLEAEFAIANATEVHQLFSDRKFDFIIFFACLEHLTNEERLISMQATWNMLSEGDLWCVIETPNRLWHFDHHTAFLPFYMWLPDDLAFQYSKYSPREPFCQVYDECTDETMLGFLRSGRGVSFHEFDLAMQKVEDLDVVSSLPMYLRDRAPLWAIGRRFMPDHRYESLVAAFGPKIHRGFYQPSLDLIICKH